MESATTQHAGQALPLLHGKAVNDFAWWRTGLISRQTFLGHIEQVSNALATPQFTLNLCEDRYLFIVAFAALLVRGQSNLLPPSRAQKEIARIGAEYGAGEALYDEDIRKLISSAQSSLAQQYMAPPDIPADHIAAIVFTSGSSGQSKANTKTWHSLYTGAVLAANRFNITANASIVATVPAQHMYGLETSVLLPLYSGASVYGGRPFFPADIRQALTCMPTPRYLVTTPAHLRICVKSELDWPPLAAVISATAPMPESLAKTTEQVFAAPVKEIYGCTEGGSLASRRTLDGDIWSTYANISATQVEDKIQVSGGHLTEPVILSDRLELLKPQQFRFLGRDEDMVNVAGKRASLANLNMRLNDIDGVEDGVFFLADNTEKESVTNITSRLAALVVAPDLSVRQILTQLAQQIDSAFIPRPLYKVCRLPRNELGKLPRQQLLQLLGELKNHV